MELSESDIQDLLVGNSSDIYEYYSLLNYEEFCPTGGATYSERDKFDEIGYWVEFVGLSIVGTVGIICNSVAIPILLSRRLTNLFNRTLACLAIFDNVFIVCDIVDSIR